MNRLAGFVGAAVALLSSMAPAGAQSSDNYVNFYAIRENHSTDIDWSNDPLNQGDLQVRLHSFALAGVGGKVGVVWTLSPLRFYSDRLKNFSFEITYRSNFYGNSNRVKPTVVVEYQEGNTTKYLTLEEKDFSVRASGAGRTFWEYDFLKKHNEPLYVTHIAVGGGEVKRPILESIPFDITVYRFRVERNFGAEPVRSYDTNVRAVSNFNFITVDRLLVTKLKGIPVANGANARNALEDRLRENARNRFDRDR